MQTRSSDPDRKPVLTNLDTQISHLATKISALISFKNILEQARDCILSISTNNLQHTNGLVGLASSPSMASSPFLPTKKMPSSLRRQAMIRNALERDKSPTPPAGSGLLSSDEFEAAFGDGVEMEYENGNGIGGGKTDSSGDVRMSVEEETTTTTSSRSTRSTTTVSVSSSCNASPARNTGFSSTNGQGAYWEAKRATKRKLQDNVAKAREARRRKLDGNGRRTA
jgi:hypothetical protein